MVRAARPGAVEGSPQEAALQENLDATHQELSVLGAEFNAMRLERGQMVAVRGEAEAPHGREGRHGWCRDRVSGAGCQ